MPPATPTQTIALHQPSTDAATALVPYTPSVRWPVEKRSLIKRQLQTVVDHCVKKPLSLITPLTFLDFLSVQVGGLISEFTLHPQSHQHKPTIKEVVFLVKATEKIELISTIGTRFGLLELAKWVENEMEELSKTMLDSQARVQIRDSLMKEDLESEAITVKVPTVNQVQTWNRKLKLAKRWREIEEECSRAALFLPSEALNMKV